MNEMSINSRNIKSSNRIVELYIEKYAGEGVSLAFEKSENQDNCNKVIFVRYAIPGEIVKARIYRETKDYGIAEPIEIIKKSPKRKDPECRYFGLCGGCDYQMINYEEQIEVKKNVILEAFNKIGKIQLSSLTGIIKSPNIYNYRNTETFKVSSKHKKIGFFRKDTKTIIDIDKCMLAMENINKALNDIRIQKDFPPHNFKVRTTNDGETVVHWIKTEKYLDKPVYERIKVLNSEIKFLISKDSFFQVNNSVIPLWLEKIISFLDKDANEKIYDLYCGIGLITLFVSYYAKETIGVEISKSSVKDANHNKVINNIKTNVQFIQGPVEEIITNLGYADVIIVDPPRKGMDSICIETIKKLKPKKIIYSSCKPSTMARDIHNLKEIYDIKEIYLVDMFPQTHHIEVLSLLEQK